MPAGKVQPPATPATPGAATPAQTPGTPQAPAFVKPGTPVGTSASDGPGIIHCKCCGSYLYVQQRSFIYHKERKFACQQRSFA